MGGYAEQDTVCREDLGDTTMKWMQKAAHKPRQSHRRWEQGVQSRAHPACACVEGELGSIKPGRMKIGMGWSLGAGEAGRRF